MKRLLSIMLLLVPCVAHAEIMVEDAWVRMPPPVSDTAAGYLTLHNTDKADVRVNRVTSNISEQTSFHTMTMSDGQMQMYPMKDVVIPAEGSLTLATGGNHLMLVGLKKALNAGDDVSFQLQLSNGEMMTIHAQVRDMRASATSHQHDMSDHHGHNH